MILTAFLILAPFALAVPSCDDNVQLTIPASALNVVIPQSLNVSTLSTLTKPVLQAFEQTLPTRQVSGKYMIAGRYCVPENQVPALASTVQLLVHGVGYDRNYWSGEGLPGSAQQVDGDKYSWVDYASQKGYATFSIDRLCNGKSTHLVGAKCQTNLNAEVLHQVVSQLRSGKIGNRSFSKVIYVGHSYGSFTGNALAQLYPQDVDTYILTGYSLRIVDGIIGSIAAYQLKPASVILPAKYGALDLTYLISTSRAGFEALFYFGSYVESIVDTDYANRGTLALGELVTILTGQLSAPQYVRNIMTITGQEDQVLCSPDQASVILGGPGDCGTGDSSAAAEVQNAYPDVKTYAWVQPASDGHCINLHTNAKAAFKSAHNFLASLA